MPVGSRPAALAALGLGLVEHEGAGRGFCSGHDVRDFRRRIESGEHEWTITTGEEGLCMRLFRLPKPIIAAINSPAVGFGVTLTLTCDLRWMADTAKIGFVFARVGLINEFGSSYLLPRIVGLGVAKELVFSTRLVEADEAQRIGLVNRVIPAAEFMEQVMLGATNLAEGPTRAFAKMKEGMHRSLADGLSDADKWEQYLLAKDIRPGAEHREGVQAFLEKRQPDFTTTRRPSQS